MKHFLRLLVLLGSLAFAVSCRKSESLGESKSSTPPENYKIASTRREIIAQHVLGAQLAPHHEVEAKSTFSPDEPIQASLYFTDTSEIGSRRILAILVSDETVVEEQGITLESEDARHELDFRFAKTPRPLGSYQIRFVEIARSSPRPVLLARLFLNVEPEKEVSNAGK
jgi:hypothetical protein